jgi:hypothetical protein
MHEDPTFEREHAPKPVPMRSDWFDQWGIDSNTVYTVEVINKNEDLPGARPDLGVIITKPDNNLVSHIIETYQANVKPGDKVKFFRKPH